MRNILYTGIAAAMLLGGSMFTSANAMPVAAHTGISQGSNLPIVEARAHFRSHRHFNRGHHYGWTRGRGNPHRGGFHVNRWH